MMKDTAVSFCADYAIMGKTKPAGGKETYMYRDDTEELREKLKDYYGTAVAEGMPMAVIDLVRVENMSDEEVRKEAEKNHIR